MVILSIIYFRELTSAGSNSASSGEVGLLDHVQSLGMRHLEGRSKSPC
jgi:hypothetical protein